MAEKEEEKEGEEGEEKKAGSAAGQWGLLSAPYADASRGAPPSLRGGGGGGGTEFPQSLSSVSESNDAQSGALEFSSPVWNIVIRRMACP